MSRPLTGPILAGLGTTLAIAGGQSLQQIGPDWQVSPTRIGRLAPDGTVTEWREHGSRQDCEWLLIFDCFEPDLDGSVSGVVGAPIGWGTCGMGEPEDPSSYRWYFGPTFQNMYLNNDMEFDPAFAGACAERIEVAWYWHVNGPGTGENMALIVETYEDFDDT